MAGRDEHAVKLPSRLKRLAQSIEIDRALAYLLASRIWQFLAGPLTAWLIAGHLSGETQGFYYAFLPLLATQTIVELGLHTLTVYAASHEWASLSLGPEGRIEGQPRARANLIQIGRQNFSWFLTMSVVFGALITPVGIWYLAGKDPGNLSWRNEWVATAVLTAASLGLQPAFSLLEGCRQVLPVYRYRFLQAVAGNVAVWLVLWVGGGLWALPASALVRLVFDCALIGIANRGFFRNFLKPADGADLHWRANLWPLQWRIALQSIFGYANTWIFTLVVFEMYGAAEGGRMGMTWSLLTALQAAAAAWIQTRSSLLGILAAQGNSSSLDQVFNRLVKVSTTVMVIGGIVLVATVAGLKAVHQTELASRQFPAVIGHVADVLAPRVLDARPTAIFCVALTLQNLGNAFGMYVRAHKRDPFLLTNLLSSATCATLVWLLTARFGVEGAAWAQLLAVLTTTLPFNFLLWRRFRETRTPTLEAETHAGGRGTEDGESMRGESAINT